MDLLITSEERLTTVNTTKGVISVVGLHCLSGFLFGLVSGVRRRTLKRECEIPTETPRMAPEYHHEKYNDEPGNSPGGCNPQGHT